jgi:hypothetical protein
MCIGALKITTSNAIETVVYREAQGKARQGKEILSLSLATPAYPTG